MNRKISEKDNLYYAVICIKGGNMYYLYIRMCMYILLDGYIKKKTVITYWTLLDILGMGTDILGKKRRGRDIFSVSYLP